MIKNDPPVKNCQSLKMKIETLVYDYNLYKNVVKFNIFPIKLKFYLLCN